MQKQKRKRTAAEKAARKRRREEFMTIFINGKQKRVRRPPTIDGMDVDEFIRRNADPIWLHQNEMWEELYELETSEWGEAPAGVERFEGPEPDDVPF
jgi:hypothetical protein